MSETEQKEISSPDEAEKQTESNNTSDINTEKGAGDGADVKEEASTSTAVAFPFRAVWELSALLKSIPDIINKLVCALKLPKLDVEKYDGDPIGYHTFIRSFDVVIETNEPDYGRRLCYLSSYLTGKAKILIQSCYYGDYSDLERYTRARELLHEYFGQNHIVAMAIINKVVKGKSIKLGDEEALENLSIELLHCKCLLQHVGYKNRFNYADVLIRIIRRLPQSLQDEWRKTANKITNEKPDEAINIDHIADFVDEKVEENRWNKVPVLPGEPAHGRPQVETDHETLCILCASVHSLQECDSFKDMTQTQRHKFATKNKLCFSCLSPNHGLNNCITAKPCPVANCKGIHHKLLHRYYI